MNLPQGFELFAILAVLVLLFGSKKLPDAARSLGRSMRIFKSETKGLRSDERGALTAAETEEERERREFAEWKASRDASGSAER
ncbi:MAG TPA: Sec-independent protein translocase subunit TatA [Frankiaceae bacterium]|jgi:sec-independent protein translocase protein TatA|nr:Sec-independent protein translocase subunit TatA [Frankiaceae bacterium]